MNSVEERQREVLSELQAEPCLRERRLEVVVREGVVHVSGVVETFDERRAVDRATKLAVGNLPFVNGVCIRRANLNASSSAWVEEVRRSVDPGPNTGQRASCAPN